MTEAANKFAVQSLKSNDQSPSEKEPWTLDLGLWTRVLNAMARELLLAQSSDWAFQIFQGTTVEYSTRRFESHIHRFDLLYKMLTPGSPPYEGGVDVASADGVVLSDEQMELLNEIESRDTIFPEIDFRIYAS